MNTKNVVLCLSVMIGGASLAAAAPACSSSSGGGGGGTDGGSSEGGGSDGGGGGVVSGPKDAHCKATVNVDATKCHVDAGAPDGGGGDTYPATMYNDEGDDDDCKYHVKWSAGSVAQGSNVTFTVTLSNKSDGSPVKGAPIAPEVFLDDKHPAPNSDPKSNETSTAGTYTVGPVKFDASGKWTVRFHIHDECDDSETSPHGHAAFFVQVP